MKKHIVKIFVFIVLSTLACQTVGVGATSTPIPTATSIPTETPTARPTNTPLPTTTSTPTPAPIGSSVIYKTLKISIVDIATHGLIYPGGYSAWYPKNKETDVFLDIGMHVENTGSSIGMWWNEIGILEENNTTWYFPVFGESRSTENGKVIDPFGITIPSDTLTGYEPISFIKGDTYLRMIFIVSKEPGNTILLSIGDAPYFTFDIE